MCSPSVGVAILPTVIASSASYSSALGPQNIPLYSICVNHISCTCIQVFIHALANLSEGNQLLKPSQHSGNVHIIGYKVIVE